MTDVHYLSPIIFSHLSINMKRFYLKIWSRRRVLMKIYYMISYFPWFLNKTFIYGIFLLFILFQKKIYNQIFYCCKQTYSCILYAKLQSRIINQNKMFRLFSYLPPREVHGFQLPCLSCSIFSLWDHFNPCSKCESQLRNSEEKINSAQFPTKVNLCYCIFRIGEQILRPSRFKNEIGEGWIEIEKILAIIPNQRDRADAWRE